MTKPNVVLIDIDTLRADHLGCYGYFCATSPNMDRLAREGVLFKDSHATAIATGPGQTSIITGLTPLHHRYCRPHTTCPTSAPISAHGPLFRACLHSWEAASR